MDDPFKMSEKMLQKSIDELKLIFLFIITINEKIKEANISLSKI